MRCVHVGWPTWCTNEELKQQYIDNYLENEGIQLDRARIEKNKGLRQVAKLCLNSFWGKFAQRPNLVQSSYIHSSDPETLNQLLRVPMGNAMLSIFHLGVGFALW